MTWAPDYVTEPELRDYCHAGIDDSAELLFAIAAASRAIDHHTNRQFGQTTGLEQRFYEARPDYRGGFWAVDIDDVQDVTGLTIVVDSDPLTTFTLQPRNAPADGKPYIRFAFTQESEFQPTGAVDEIAVTAKFGWNAVPTAVKQATLLQGSRIFTRRNAPFGVAGSPESGSEMRLLAKLDPDVVTTLAPYFRMRRPG